MKVLTATYADCVEAIVAVNDDEAEAALAALKEANKFPAEVCIQMHTPGTLEGALEYLADFS